MPDKPRPVHGRDYRLSDETLDAFLAAYETNILHSINTQLLDIARCTALLEDEDGGRRFPSKALVADARAAIAAAREKP